MKKNGLILLLLMCAYPYQTKANVKELRIPLQSTVITLDPGGVQDGSSLFVARQVNCQLIINEGSNIILDAAESIKYITPLKIAFKINDDAKFHDGSSVTSIDVLASLNYIKNSRNIFNNFFVWIDKIEIIDNKTLIFLLKKETPQFLKLLSTHDFYIFKKSFLENAKRDKKLWNKPLSCGGYKVSEFNNAEIKLTPVHNGIPIVFYLNMKNYITASEIDKYDIVGLKVIGESAALNNFKTISAFDPIQVYIGLNSKSKLWKNKYERCKFLSSLDPDHLLSSYKGEATAARDFLPKGAIGYSENDDFNNQLISLAKKTENNGKQLKPFCLSYLTVSLQENNKNEFLKMIKKHYPIAFMKPIKDVKKFGKDFIKSNCDAIIFSWWSNYLDGHAFFSIFENSNVNFSGLHNKGLSEEILKSQDIVNPVQRSNEYRKIISRIAELCVIKPLFTKYTQKIYIRNDLKTPGIGLITFPHYYLGNVSRIDDSNNANKQ